MCAISQFSSWKFWELLPATYNLFYECDEGISTSFLLDVSGENKQRLLRTLKCAVSGGCFTPWGPPAGPWAALLFQGSGAWVCSYSFVLIYMQLMPLWGLVPEECDQWPCCCLPGLRAFVRCRTHSFQRDFAPANPRLSSVLEPCAVK